jgi:hypothetical protein
MNEYSNNTSNFTEINLTDKLSISGGSGIYWVYLEQLAREEILDLKIDLSQ